MSNGKPVICGVSILNSSNENSNEELSFSTPSSKTLEAQRGLRSVAIVFLDEPCNRIKFYKQGFLEATEPPLPVFGGRIQQIRDYFDDFYQENSVIYGGRRKSDWQKFKLIENSCLIIASMFNKLFEDVLETFSRNDFSIDFSLRGQKVSFSSRHSFTYLFT